MNVPEGYTQRPLRLDEAPAVTAVMMAEQLVDLGEVIIEEADIVGDWQRPSFDVGASTIGVFQAAQLVAYAEVSGPDRGAAAVRPEHRGRGLGTALAGWMQATATRQGCSTIGMPVPVGSPGEALLRSLGYHQRWTSWVLALPEGKNIAAQSLPEGYVVRQAADGERATVHSVIEDAFLEWSMQARTSFEDFEAGLWLRPGFEPWNVRVAADPSGEVVGVSHLIVDTNVGNCFVDKLAVRRDRRGLGLARALLADSFAVARAHGTRGSELSTDSRTGALGLYEKVGMEVTSTWVNLAITL